jgi:hypothetical protein
MPVVSTVPLTDMSSAITTLQRADAIVLTGGTSRSPFNIATGGSVIAVGASAVAIGASAITFPPIAEIAPTIAIKPTRDIGAVQ